MCLIFATRRAHSCSPVMPETNFSPHISFGHLCPRLKSLLGKVRERVRASTRRVIKFPLQTDLCHGAPGRHRASRPLPMESLGVKHLPARRGAAYWPSVVRLVPSGGIVRGNDACSNGKRTLRPAVIESVAGALIHDS